MSLSATANTVHLRLLTALDELREAEGQAILLFAEVMSKRLFTTLGYPSINVYAEQALHFSNSKTMQFIRLAQSLNDLPRLRDSLKSGKTSWTKARVVAAVATPKTESTWVQKAETRSRRDLEATVALVRAAARTGSGSGRSLTEPISNGSSTVGDTALKLLDGGESCAAGELDLEDLARDVPLSKTFRFTAEQASQFETLVEAARKRGVAGTREELLLAALEILVAHSGRDAGENGTINRANNRRAAHQVIVHQCPQCGQGTVQANGKQRKLTPAQMARILCDADIVTPGERMHATIPPAARREVLIRDHHECQVEGCKNTFFLEVHHQVPRSRGGKNKIQNLITVCSNCHKFLHDFDPQRNTRVFEQPKNIVGYGRTPKKDRPSHLFG